MKRFVVLFVAALLVALPVTAHAGWAKTYGGSLDDGARCVSLTPDGGYIFVGSTNSFGVGDYDILLVKTDAQGDTLWTQTYGTPNTDLGVSVHLTDDGNYTLLGNVRTQENEYLVWLLKVNPQGETLWTETLSGGNPSAYRSEPTSDGGYIIAGDIHSQGIESYCFWMAKTNASGQLLWERRYGGKKEYDVDMAESVTQTSDGGYIITGRAYPTDTSKYWNLWLIKTDEYGDSVWSKFYGGELKDGGTCVKQTSDGGYIVAGFVDYTSDCTRGGVWLLKTDEYGDTSWTRKFGGEVATEYPCEVIETMDGGYLIAGLTYSYDVGGGDVWLVKTDEMGDTLWTQNFGGAGFECGYSLSQTSDNGYIVAAITGSYGAGESDAWLIKTEANGDTVTVSEKPVAPSCGFELLSPIGQRIVLQYKDRPQGFSASIFDASGRIVDEIYAAGSSGTITWGERQTSGVYFIKVDAETPPNPLKVILIN